MSTSIAPNRPWVIYTRVSTDDQATEGVSLAAQQQQCAAMMTALRMPVLESIEDGGYSAKSLKRPGMERLLALVAAGTIGGIVVAKLDRMTRCLRDLIELVERLDAANVGLLSVVESLDTRSPSGRFFLHMIGAIAQWERETIAARVKSSMAHIRAQGFFAGGRVPAGCTLQGPKGKRTLVRGPSADVIAQAWPMVRQGASLRDVAAFLTRSGVPAPANKVRGRSADGWAATQVSRLLNCQGVIGVLVDAATFAEVRATLGARRNPFKSTGTNLPSTRTERVWIGGGILRCGVCGAALCGVHGRNRAGVMYPYLRCTERAKGRCRAPELPAEAVERALVAGVLHAVTGTYADSYAAALTRIARESQAKAQPLQDRRDVLVKECATLRHKRDTLIDLAEEPGIVKRALVEKIAEAQVRLEAAEAEVARIDGELSACRLSEREARTVADGVARFLADLPSLPPTQQREALALIVKQARLDQSGAEPCLDLELYVPPGTLSDAGEFVCSTALVLLNGFEPLFAD